MNLALVSIASKEHKNRREDKRALWPATSLAHKRQVNDQQISEQSASESDTKGVAKKKNPTFHSLNRDLWTL